MGEFEFDDSNPLNCIILETGSGPVHILRVMRMKAMMEYSTKEKYAKLLLNDIDSKCILFANTQAQAGQPIQGNQASVNTSHHNKSIR